MAGFKKVFGALLFLASIVIGSAAQGAADADTQRFGGETQIGSRPPIPLHIELRRSGDAVTGTLSTPIGNFELLEAKWANPIVGHFRGNGGASGALTLRLDGDVLTGTFDLGGQSGTFKARRTTKDAAAFFRPPEQRFDLTAAQWLEDLDQMVEILTKEHASPFHRISRDQFERDVAQLRAKLDGPKLDGIAVALEFRKLGASIGDGHTSVALPHGRDRLPVEFYWFDDGLRLVGISAAHRNLLGARLTAVNEVPVAEVTERLRAYIAQGETQLFDRASVPDFVNNPDILRAIGAGAGPSFVFTFETPDGARKQVEITAVAEVRDEAILGDGKPLWQRNEAQGFWSEWLADGSLYVNWRSYDGLADHATALLQSLDARHPRRLIVDLRDNEGGDYTVGRSFIEGIASRLWLNQRGVLYVMIGRKTFSAAMTNAVDFKKTTAATLVGEPAGAAPNNWQEVRRTYLPNSGLSVGVSTRYYEFLPGQAELVPDLGAPPEPGDWGNLQDAGVRLVLAQPVR